MCMYSESCLVNRGLDNFLILVMYILINKSLLYIYVQLKCIEPTVYTQSCIHEVLDITDQVFMYTIILARSHPLPWDSINIPLVNCS